MTLLYLATNCFESKVHWDSPCHHLYNDTEQPLSSYIIPTLSSWADQTTSAAPDVTQEQMDDIVDMCQSLYQNDSKMRDATFYEHLMQLTKKDGVRLATAQMTIASGDGNKHYAGGDLLRMANNMVKFQKLQQSHPSNIQLLTLSMDDFIHDTAAGTLQFLNFVFGQDNEAMPQELRQLAALKQAAKYERKKKGSHVTQEDSKAKDRLKKILRNTLMKDRHLGPILNLTEVLVNEVLADNE